MCQEPGLTPEHQKMEAIMGQLRPSARSLDHEMLIFEAGRAAQGSKRPWQLMCGVLTMLLCGSLLMQVPQTKPTTPVALVQQIPASVPFVEMQQAGPSLGYLNLQKTVLRNGLDALPAHRAVRALNQKQLDQETLLQDLMSSDEAYSGLL
jgi:hypothetical protein